MNLDDKIKQALQMDTEEVERLMSKEQGLFERLFGIFRGNMRLWNIFAMVISMVTAILMFYSGYYFFISESQDDRLFWGILLLAFWTGIMGLKIWFWMKMNHHATSREIKRHEQGGIAEIQQPLYENIYKTSFHPDGDKLVTTYGSFTCTSSTVAQ